MKAGTAIGLVIGIGGLFLGATMEGANVMAVLNPAAMLIVLGGTLGATVASCGVEGAKLIPALYKKALSAEVFDLRARVAEMVEFAEQARRDGLLALDQKLGEIEDPFIKKGLQLVVDGTDPDLVIEILELENASLRKRHAAGAAPFDKGGGFAPTMGIIGTVFGLIHVLENLDAPETLGPAISAAFIATLIGVGAANVIFLPVANRLKQLSSQELHFRAMTLEGILAIQAGDNPRVVEEKLLTFVPPDERDDSAEAKQAVADPDPTPVAA